MGNLKFFEWSKILITYIKYLIFLLYEKKIEKNLKRTLKKRKNEKRQKIPSDINFPQRTTTLPLKNLTLRPISSKKVSPDAPKSFARGVGVLKSNKNQFLESSNTAVVAAAEITLFKNNFFFTMLKKT